MKFIKLLTALNHLKFEQYLSTFLKLLTRCGVASKLAQNGISGNLLKLFQNYLNNRKQRVVLNGSFYEYSKIRSGVPHGSIFGPLLFLICNNDLEKNIKSNIKFFADVTMLFSIVKDANISANYLNHDLDIINRWAH